MSYHKIHWIHTTPKIRLSNGDPICHLSPRDDLCNTEKTTLRYINHPRIYIFPTTKEGFINHPTLCRMRLRVTTATLTPLCIGVLTLLPFFLFTKYSTQITQWHIPKNIVHPLLLFLIFHSYIINALPPSTNSEYNDNSGINFSLQFTLNQVDSTTNLLDNVVLTEVFLRPTEKPWSVSPHRLISKKTRSKKKSFHKNQKLRSVSKPLCLGSVDLDSNDDIIP